MTSAPQELTEEQIEQFRKELLGLNSYVVLYVHGICDLAIKSLRSPGIEEAAVYVRQKDLDWVKYNGIGMSALRTRPEHDFNAPLYARPPLVEEAEKMRQEFWWLIEAENAWYATGENTDTWTKDSAEAARFYTKNAAEAVKNVMRLYMWEENGNLRNVRVEQHGFIYGALAPEAQPGKEGGAK